VDKREETIGRDGWMTTAGSARGFRHWPGRALLRAESTQYVAEIGAHEV